MEEERRRRRSPDRHRSVCNEVTNQSNRFFSRRVEVFVPYVSMCHSGFKTASNKQTEFSTLNNYIMTTTNTSQLHKISDSFTFLFDQCSSETTQGGFAMMKQKLNPLLSFIRSIFLTLFEKLPVIKCNILADRPHQVFLTHLCFGNGNHHTLVILEVIVIRKNTFSSSVLFM